MLSRKRYKYEATSDHVTEQNIIETYLNYVSCLRVLKNKQQSNNIMSLMPFTRDIFSPSEDFGFPLGFPLGGTAKLEDIRPMPLDVVEKKEHYDIKADIPGVKKENIHIMVDKGNILRLKVETEEKKEEKKDEDDEKWHRYERSYSFAQRSLRMPEEADLQHIKAKYEDGVLKLVVPKSKERAVQNRVMIE